MHRKTYQVWEIYSKQDPRRHQNNLEALERSWREQGRHSGPFLLWVALAQMQIWQCNSFNFYRCADPTVQRKILSLYPSFVLWFCSSLSRESERERCRPRTLSSLENLSWSHRNPRLPSYLIGTDFGWPQQVPLIYLSLFLALLLFQSLKRM